MRRNSQSGNSFAGTLGHFFIFAVVCAIGIYFLSVQKHEKRIEKVVASMTGFFQKYQENLPEYVRQRTHISNSKFLEKMGLVEECRERESVFDKNKKVCKLSLGEMDVSTKYDKHHYYTYVYVHFTDIYKVKSCSRFLSIGWERILPRTWWGKEGYIGVISESTAGKIYFSLNPEYIRNDGAEITPTQQHLEEICGVCKGSRYCSVLFFFDVNENSFAK